MNALACAVRQRGVPVEEISVGGTPSRFIVHQKGATEMRPGNYGVLRSDAGGAAERGARRLRAGGGVHRGQPARAQSRHLRCRQQDADVGRRRGFAPQPGHGLVYPAVDTPEPDASIVIGAPQRGTRCRRARRARCTLSPGDRVFFPTTRAWSHMVDDCSSCVDRTSSIVAGGRGEGFGSRLLRLVRFRRALPFTSFNGRPVAGNQRAESVDQRSKDVALPRSQNKPLPSVSNAARRRHRAFRRRRRKLVLKRQHQLLELRRRESRGGASPPGRAVRGDRPASTGAR